MSIPAQPADQLATVTRKPVPRRVRFEVLRRDNYTCRYCRSTDNPLTIDHVIPVVLGGTDEPSNLVACCKDCNIGKSSIAPDAAMVAQVGEDAMRWSVAMRVAAQQAADAREEARARLQPWHDQWFLLSGMGRSFILPNNADDGLKRLLDLGLPMDQMLDAGRIACTVRGIDDRFRYFMGVSYRMLSALQERARQLLMDGTV